MEALLAYAPWAAAAALLLLAARPLLFVARCLRARRWYAQDKAPGPPMSPLIIGHIAEMIGPKAPWTLAKWTNEYGPLYKMQFFGALSYVVSEPSEVQRLLRKTGAGPYCPKPHEIYQALDLASRPPMPNVLTADDGPYWRAVRTAAAPFFSASNLKKVLPLVVRLSERVAARVAAAAAEAPGGAATVDVADAAKRITSDVMGQMLYGEDLRGTEWEPSTYLELFYPVLRAQGALVNNPWHLLQLWRPEVRHQRRCMVAFDRLMDGKIQRLMDHPPPDYTIAAHLLAVVDPATGRPLTKHQLKSEVGTFMAAGFETTSHAITWTLAALAAHPGVQQDLAEELKAAGLAAGPAGPGRPFEASDLGHLPLLSAVIREVLRLCSPAPWGGTRIVPEDTVICGFPVRKGSYIQVPLISVALSAANYGPSPLSFDPSRWLAGAAAAGQPEPEEGGGGGGDDVPAGGRSDQDAAAAGQAGAKAKAQQQQQEQQPLADPLSFLTGPRDCIGQNLAKLELQVVLATLLSRFSFSPGPRLQQELGVAAATGQPPMAALHALAGVHVTMQPEEGELLLEAAPRA